MLAYDYPCPHGIYHGFVGSDVGMEHQVLTGILT